MAYRIGQFAAALILGAIYSISAQATTTVICNQILQNGTDFAQCSDSTVDSQTDPNLGVQEAVGTAEAIADLRTGALRSRSVAQAYRFGTYDVATGANSIAALDDTITIGGGYSGLVQVRMDVSGVFLLNDPNTQMGGTVSYPGMAAYLSTFNSAVDLGTAGAFVNHYNNAPNGFVVRFEHSSTSAGGDVSSNADPTSANFTDPADVRLVLTSSFAVTPSSPTFTVLARLGTHTAFSHFNPLADQLLISEVDFGNSAHLSLILPAGVPWTSGSGVFLSAVPEPGTSALLAAGMVGLCAFRRDRLQARLRVRVPSSR